MWVRFLKETTYIPSLINQLNGRKMFFIKLDSNIFYKMRQFFVTLSCCSYSAVYNKVIYLSRYNGQQHWLFLSTIQYRQMRQKRKKSNITNTKSTTIPTLQNSINKTLSQPKNTKSSLLSPNPRGLRPPITPYSSQTNLSKKPEESMTKNIYSFLLFLIEPKKPAKAAPFPIHS